MFYFPYFCNGSNSPFPKERWKNIQNKNSLQLWCMPPSPCDNINRFWFTLRKERNKEKNRIEKKQQRRRSSSFWWPWFGKKINRNIRSSFKQLFIDTPHRKTFPFSELDLWKWKENQTHWKLLEVEQKIVISLTIML